MSKTLIISFLPREGSNTAKLVDAFKQAAGDATEIVERKLDNGSIPMINEIAMKTWWGPATENEVETASAEFIDELKAADNIIVATPMYNWSMPAPVKAWFDLVIRGGQTFEFGESGPKGLLDAQNAAIFVTTGMTAVGGESDHLTPVATTGFGMMGIKNNSIVGASELMIVGEDESASRMDRAVEEAKALAKKWFAN